MQIENQSEKDLKQSNGPQIRVRRLFDEPKDKLVPIWRFMDFTKYVAILQNKGLFFSRCDHLGDSFEGSVPRAMRKGIPGTPNGEPLSLATAEQMHAGMSELNKWVRKWALINCWHMNECESAAMWKLYAQTNEAIAIVSTYERLRRCLGDEYWIEMVQYIDYEKETIPEGNIMYPFIYKRRSFAHERELRAFTVDLPRTVNQVDLDLEKLPSPSSKGVWIGVNLNELIETVRVAPKSPPWFLELVCELSKKYEPHAPVKQSSLDLDPVY